MKRERDSSSALLWLARGGPGPGQELVEAIVRPEIDQAGETPANRDAMGWRRGYCIHRR